MMDKQFFRICIAMFLIATLLYPSFGMMNTSTQIIGTARADYVEANNNTNCIEEDPLVPGWSKDVRLTNDSAESEHPDIAVDSKNNIYVVWQDHRDESYELYYKKSRDGGKTWCSDTRLTSISGSDKAPSVTIDQNDGIHVVWSHGGGGNAEIYYKNSLDGGDIWSGNMGLTHASGDSFTPKIVAYEDTLHVVWSDKRDGNFEIYYKRSDDGGNSWSDDRRLSNTTGDSRVPYIAVDLNGNLQVVWQEESTLGYKNSMDKGDTWSAIKTINNSTMGSLGGIDTAVDSKGDIHVVWGDTRDQGAAFEHIYYDKYTNEKNMWMNSSIDITKNFTSIDSFMPSIVCDVNDNIYVVWKSTNRSDNSNELYYTKSKDGIVWDPVTRLTHVIYGSRMQPEIAIDKNNILHLTWFDQREDEDQNLEIYYKNTIYSVSEKPITVTQSLNQTMCKPGNSITVSGNAVYNNSIVPNANVTIKILETGDEWTIKTDSNGDYSKTIIAPDTSGNYTIRVTVTSGNHTGWKMMRLSVEQESTNGGTTNGGTTNGVQQPSDVENKLGINFNYVVMIAGMIAVCIVIGLVLVKHRGTTSAKMKKEKTEKTALTLRCPKCRKTFSVEVKPKPFSVKCPYCGKEGAIK